MRWTDVAKIAEKLEDHYPEKDNVNVRYTDMRQWILSLPEFAGLPDACNEGILEAIQMAWINEREDRLD